MISYYLRSDAGRLTGIAYWIPVRETVFAV